MMKLCARALILGAAFTMTACGGEQQPASVYLDDLGAHMSAFQGDITAHATGIENAATLAAVTDLEGDHAKSVQRYMDMMDRDVDEMGACTDGGGGMMSVGMMTGLLDQAMAECDRHQMAMGKALDMGAAHAEEAQHQATMGGIMNQMKSSREGMMSGEAMGGSGMHMCPMGGR